jgi:N-acetylglucosamine-6-phosphate deacetylase
MSPVKYFASQLATSEARYEQITFTVENGLITEISEGQSDGAIPLEGVVIPGFVDIHCHGGGGFDLSLDQKGAHFHLKHGTTSLLASFISEPIDSIKNKLSKIELKDNLIGVHLEGPYLSHAHCGAHKLEYLVTPKLDDLREIVATGKVRYITIAPEISGALDAISYLSKHMKVAIGHSAASGEIVKEAIANGVSVVTHFYNAMKKDIDDLSCLAAYSLNQSSLFLELIIDGVHLTYPIIKEVIRRAPERIIGITDAAPFAGKIDGQYQLGELAVSLEGGIARLSSNGALAGSMLTMDRAFKNAMENLGLDLSQAIKAFSTNPARAIGQEDVGDIAVGRKANFLLLDQDWNLKQVYFEGELVA